MQLLLNPDFNAPEIVQRFGYDANRTIHSLIKEVRMKGAGSRGSVYAFAGNVHNLN